MEARYLTAIEHEVIPVVEAGAGLGLTTAEADLLTTLAERRPGFCERGHRSVRLAQYCGIVNVGTRLLEILPKIHDSASPAQCRGVLLRLLRYADAFTHFRNRSAGQHLRHAPLLDVFIAEFFDAVTDIVRGGLLRQYRERDEDLRVVRGRIMTGRQFANLANRLDVVSCRYDDLTADNHWNRSLKAGLRAVRPWIGSVGLYRRWVELTAVFEEVSDVKPSLRELERWVFDRQAARYRDAVRWVHWILSLLSPSLRAGENVAPALLFDMNLLFQEAVAALLRRRVAADPSIRVDTQQSDRHLAVIADTDIGAFKLTPDLVIRRHTDILAVADTKWKRLQVNRSGHLLPIEADVYQMNAYGSAFQCDELTLMYPWFDTLQGSKETSFVLPRGALKQRMHVLCLDVGADPPAVIRGADSSPVGRLLNPRADARREGAAKD